MIGHRTSLREDDDLPLWRAPAIKKKPRVKLRAVRMRNAIQRNDLNQFQVVRVPLLYNKGILFLRRFLHCTEEDLQPFVKRLNDKVRKLQNFPVT